MGDGEGGGWHAHTVNTGLQFANEGLKNGGGKKRKEKCTHTFLTSLVQPSSYQIHLDLV